MVGSLSCPWSPLPCDARAGSRRAGWGLQGGEKAHPQISSGRAAPPRSPGSGQPAPACPLGCKSNWSRRSRRLRTDRAVSRGPAWGSVRHAGEGGEAGLAGDSAGQELQRCRDRAGVTSSSRRVLASGSLVGPRSQHCPPPPPQPQGQLRVVAEIGATFVGSPAKEPGPEMPSLAPPSGDAPPPHSTSYLHGGGAPWGWGGLRLRPGRDGRGLRLRLRLLEGQATPQGLGFNSAVTLVLGEDSAP